MNNERKVTFHDDDEPIKWTEMSGSPEARAETYRNVGNRALETSEKKERNWDEIREKAKRALYGVAKVVAGTVIVGALLWGVSKVGGEEHPDGMPMPREEWTQTMQAQLDSLHVKDATIEFLEDGDSSISFSDGVMNQYRYTFVDEDNDGDIDYAKRNQGGNTREYHSTGNDSLGIVGAKDKLDRNIPR